MNKISISLLFILAGLAYGSLAFDVVNNATIGFLIKNKWLRPPVLGSTEKDLLGPKPTILLYSVILIAIGIFVLISNN